MSLQRDNIITKDHRPSQYDLAAGALILVDKPKDWTSFDVVNKIRHAIRHHLQVKKFKVGHSGTLDPMATGLLLICIGKYTKLLHDLTAANKAYTGTIKLGATTPSYDAESDIDQEYAIDHITDDLILSEAKEFVGGYNQVPPIYSAIKMNGQALYKLARRGEAVELKPRSIMIHEFEIKEIDMPDVNFYCACGKGTYIRSLAYDLGANLDSGGYLTALNRVSIEEYQLNDALSIDQVVEWVRSTDLPTE